MRNNLIAMMALAAVPGIAVMAHGTGGELAVSMQVATAQGPGKSVGTIEFHESGYGVLIEPHLTGLEPGPHGLHLHENGSCAPGADGIPAGNAGDHYDPGSTRMHAGPYGAGHLGDLPNLFVEADGSARIPMLAPRISLEDLHGRALMIHAEPDLYDAHADHDHGKGGSRMYCGVAGSGGTHGHDDARKHGDAH